MVQQCERMAGSVRVGWALDGAPSSRVHSRAVVIAEGGFCIDADHLLPGDYLAAHIMDRVAHRRPQTIGLSGMGGAGALINTTTSLGEFSDEQRVVAGAERIVQTTETTASYSRT